MNTPTHAPLTETVKIERLIHGGQGLARLSNGRVVFVPWVVPGDEASIEVRETAPKKPPQVMLNSLEKRSDERVDPPCSVFGECGGCQWQHVSEKAQQHWKREIITESLRRLGKLENVTVNEVIALQPWEYRNNVQWVPDAEKRMGYYRHQSHDVIAFDRCHIVPPAFNALKDWLNANPSSGLTGVQVRINPAGNMLLALEGEKPDVSWLDGMKAACPAVMGVVIGDKALYGEPTLDQPLGDKTFRVSAQSFFQINNAVAERMIEILGNWLPQKAEALVDFYAGVGTFSLNFADRFDSVVAVESFGPAIEDLRANISDLNKPNVEVFAGLSRDAIKTLKQTFDAAIVDPPRAGIEKYILDWLAANVTQTIIYVSCDPATLARDLAVLAAAGWQIDEVQPLDMFPQTHHVETLVKLSKSDSL